MKLSEKFNSLKMKDEGALITYICAGDPSQDLTKRFVKALVEGGADIVELGLPSSDPLADGPTIQAASQRALLDGMNTDRYFELVSEISNTYTTIPFVCMTYYNLILQRGLKRFVKNCTDSGICGLIVPDLPVEESKILLDICLDCDIDYIFLITPTSTDERIEMILEQGSGFLYLVSRVGVTGVKMDISESTKEILSRVETDIPKAVGFGISTGMQAKEIIQNGADGVIVGSALVDIIASNDDVEGRLKKLAIELKSGCI
jgi:tryptophan synthase alpha chain